MKDRHWNSLIFSLRHGQCVLVLGPELPTESSEGAETVNSMQVLIGRVTRELEEDNRNVKGRTLAEVAQQYEDAQALGFGPNSLRALAESHYKSPIYSPSALHEVLALLPFTLIITTCHDNLLKRALQRAGKEPLVQRFHIRGTKTDNPEFMIPGSPNAPVVYHLFGDAEQPNSMVLSENDLLDFIIAIASERPPLPNSLRTALQRSGQTFLFVGFGIKHWYQRVLLKLLVRVLELDRTGSAIATETLRELSQTDRDQIVFFYQRGPRIEVEDADITTFLSELSDKLAAGGGFAGKPSPLGSRPRVFISYAREDDAVAARLFDALQSAYFEPWRDEQSLTGGIDWDQRIRDELESTDYVLVLYTPALCKKRDSYVNKEIALAADRAMRVRGSFIIPLRTDDIAPEERITELDKYQEMELRPGPAFDKDVSAVISVMRREYQRRSR